MAIRTGRKILLTNSVFLHMLIVGRGFGESWSLAHQGELKQ